MYPVPGKREQIPGLTSEADHFHDITSIFRYRVSGSCYAMLPPLQPDISCSPGTFTLFIAPSAVIREALSTLLSRHQGQVLYICGNYPAILPKIPFYQSRLQIRRALTAYQILTILDESDESLILFEHDSSLYEDNAELLPCLGETCRDKARTSRVIILFAERFDKWVTLIESYGNRVVYHIESEPPAKKVLKPSHLSQKTLDGVW